MVSFLGVPLFSHIVPDFGSGVLPDLGLALVLRETVLGGAGDGVQGAGDASTGVGILDATLGFLAFLVLIFSSSSEEGHGDTDPRP